MIEQGKIIAGLQSYKQKQRKKVPQVRFPQQQTKPRRWILKLSLAILVLCALVWGWLKIINPQTFPIHSVRIEGNYSHVNQALMRATIVPFLQRGFLGINTADLQDKLSQMPWVYQVTVQRAWPDSIIINLTEQQAIARFNNQSLLNSQGELFSVDQGTLPTDLPLFIGNPGQQELLLQTYHQMLSILTPLGLKINILALDDRQSWRMQLSNGVVLFVGNNDPLLRLQRFVVAYPQVIGTKSAMVKYVDLRYAHGIAVKFNS